MSVLVVGISHQTAPVALLERLALDADGVDKLLGDVAAREHVDRGHRARHLQPDRDLRRRSTASTAASRRSRGCSCERAGESTEAMLPHLYVHYDDGAVSHLFHVAAGLDSMVVGEGQILGQIREALRLGQELGTVGPALNVLFQQALRVGKRTHAETDIDRAAPSLVSVGARRGPTAGRRRRRDARARGRRRRDGRARRRHRSPPRRRRDRGRQPHRRQRRAAGRASTPAAPAPLDRARRRARRAPTSCISCTGADRRAGRLDQVVAARAGRRPAARDHRPGAAARRRPRGRRAARASP